MIKIILLTVLALTFTSAQAEDLRSKTLSLAAPFGDHGILQQKIPVPVWGTAGPKAQVTITFASQTKTTIADELGKWRVVLDPLKADVLTDLHKALEGRELVVSSELGSTKESIKIKNILIGEVWVCAGQSNMAAKVRHNFRNQDPDDNLLKSNLPNIRQNHNSGKWILATPGKAVGEFSRVGFCFAREVQSTIKVPVGLVNACVGGSNIESWMRVAEVKSGSEPKGKKINYGKLYQERLAPSVGYGIKGILWYQGEANASEGHSYFLKMKALIADWRKSWNQGVLPFYFVQLAGIGKSPDNPEMGDGRARVREAQRKVLTIKNTGMAVAVDIGGDKEHPANKVEVGIRLAQWALNKCYERKNVVSGPLYKSFKVEGSSVRINFDFSRGLMFAEKTNYKQPKPTPNKKLLWISIQSQDGRWHWADAKVDDKTLIVSSKKVVKPKAVRYAYTNRPLGCYLYNDAGLPASPFEFIIK